ncbi:hypothetical protein QYF36_003598 [Acer negundo]|nr:hypothetical protein QYF36_003598 [Acer negundo]
MVYQRYIRGARFFGNSNVDVDPVVAIDIGQPTFEVAIVKNKTNPTSISTFRARLVGQGYNLFVDKQMYGVTELYQKFYTECFGMKLLRKHDIPEEIQMLFLDMALKISILLLS